MLFVDTNVFVYAVGRPHPLREPARASLRQHVEAGTPLATSAEVLQELLHVYLPVGRLETLDAALTLAATSPRAAGRRLGRVRAARDLVVSHPGSVRATCFISPSRRGTVPRASSPSTERLWPPTEVPASADPATASDSLVGRCGRA